MWHHVEMAGKGDPSGMIVYPKLPVPQGQGQRPSEHRISSGGGGNAAKVAGGAVLVAALGGAIGYLAAPSNKDALATAKKDLAAAQTAAKTEKDRADGAEKQLAVTKKDKEGLEQKLSETTTKMADADKKASEAAAAKLQSAIDKSQGSVSTEGEEIHLKLVDRVLFAVGDDQLTANGKLVLDKVAKALTDLPDKQVWVQGHTDDQPIIIPPAAKKDPKAKKPAPGAAKTPEVPMVRFASNWELSAARALQVVHYLQDHGKIAPARLAALAFGEYRPVSKSNKALNRRIEIVLYPQHAVIEKGALPKPAAAAPAPATKTPAPATKTPAPAKKPPAKKK